MSTTHNVSSSLKLTEFSLTPIPTSRSLFVNPFKRFQQNNNTPSPTTTTTTPTTSTTISNTTTNDSTVDDNQYYYFYEHNDVNNNSTTPTTSTTSTTSTTTMNKNTNNHNSSSNVVNGSSPSVFISSTVQSLMSSDVERYLEVKQRMRESSAMGLRRGSSITSNKQKRKKNGSRQQKNGNNDDDDDDENWKNEFLDSQARVKNLKHVRQVNIHPSSNNMNNNINNNSITIPSKKNSHNNNNHKNDGHGESNMNNSNSSSSIGGGSGDHFEYLSMSHPNHDDHHHQSWTSKRVKSSLMRHSSSPSVIDNHDEHGSSNKTYHTRKRSFSSVVPDKNSLLMDDDDKLTDNNDENRNNNNNDHDDGESSNHNNNNNNNNNSNNNANSALLLGSSYTGYSSLLHSRKEHLKLENRLHRSDSGAGGMGGPPLPHHIRMHGDRERSGSLLKRSRSDNSLSLKGNGENEENDGGSNVVKDNNLRMDSENHNGEDNHDEKEASNRAQRYQSRRLSLQRNYQPVTNQSFVNAAYSGPASPVNAMVANNAVANNRRQEHLLARTLMRRTSSKQFWMPDNRVSTCYQCEAPFSVVKRKHHCRVCGQIFCWKCSNNFVEGQQYGYSGKVRVCGHCLNILTNQIRSPTHESMQYIDLNPNPSTESIKKLYTSQNVVGNYSTIETEVSNNNSDPSKQSSSESTVPMPIKSSPSKTQESYLSESVDDMVIITQHETNKQSLDGDSSPISPNSEICLHPSSISGEEFEQKFDDHLKSIEDISQQHLRKVITQLLQEDNVDMAWKDVIVGLALRTVNCINPQPNLGDKMDIRHYVKIKKIPGSKFESEYVDGVVFKKNVVHKKMRTNAANPRLLLFGCPIEFHRVENQMANFNILMGQEEEFFKLLLKRIELKKPDLVIVQKPVSGIFQEMLVQQKISLLVNVKRGVMERISRCTGYPILNSVDEIELVRDDLGACTSMQVSRAFGSWANKTLFIIKGANPETGCTIALRGENLNELKLVKKIMRFAVYVAYNLRLEAELFFDECGTFVGQSQRRRAPSITTDKRPSIESHELNNSTMDDETTSLVSAQSSESSAKLEEKILSVSPYVTIPLRFEEWTDEIMDNGEYEYSKKSSALDKSLLSSKMLSPLSHQNIVVLFTKILKHDSAMKESVNDFSHQDYGVPEIIVIAYYTENDMALGQFLETKCFNPALLKENLSIIRTYTHDEGRIKVTIEKADHITYPNNDDCISMWSFCKLCQKHVTPVVPMSEGTYKYSFGKFLETGLYNHTLVCRTGNCKHSIHEYHVRCFGYKDFIAKFEYEPVTVYKITVPSNELCYSSTKQQKCFDKFVTEVSEACGKLYGDLFLCASNMESNVDFVEMEDQIELFRTSLEQQYENLKVAIESIRQEVNMYRLNHMIKNIYITAKTWNTVIEDLIDESKHPNSIKVNNKLARENKRLQSRRANVTMNDATTPPKPARSDSNDSVASTNLIHSDYIIITLTASNDAQRPIKSVILTSKSLGSPIPHSSSSNSIVTNVDSSFAVPKLTLSANTPTSMDQVPYLVSPTGRSPPSPFELSNGSKLPHSMSLTALSTSVESAKSPAFGNSAILASLYNKNNKVVPVEIPKLISSVAPYMNLQSNQSDSNIIVYNDEPSTIIAYTLCSNDYHNAVQDDGDFDACSDDTRDYDTTDDEDTDSVDERYASSAVEQHMTSKENNHFKFVFNTNSSETVSDSETGNAPTRGEKKGKNDFYCTCYFAKQFAALRRAYCSGDVQFIHSLSRCKQWTPTGGKSKSTFTKTWDDRFVIKQISRVELLTFLETGPAYFDYMVNALFHELPTVLCKIIGVYRIGYYHKGKLTKQDVIIMDNLFYDRNVDRTYDLKGSERNRYQKEMGAVLLDENLLKSMYAGSPPLITRQLSKGVLSTSIHNDTLFLSKLNVMDYSLLVGVDDQSQELIVGIIDYVRQYTWDKHLETWVKSAGIISSKGKVPTVISPKNYKSRFREAMERYFLLTPDKFTGLLQLLSK